RQPRASDEDSGVPMPAPRAPLKPVVTPLDVPPSGAAATASGAAATPSTGDNVVEPSQDRDQDLADGIAAYDNGRPQEALPYLRRLSTDPNDKAAKFMVGLIEARGAAPAP